MADGGSGAAVDVGDGRVQGNGERSRAPGPVRWAAPGGLRSLVAALAEGLPVELGHKVTRVGPGPTVDGDAADAVVLAMPDPQARRILADTSPATAELDGREWQPVISVAAGWARREWPPMNAAFVNDHPVISLVADDGDRRGDGAPVLVAHSVADVARRYDACPDDAVAPVLEALRRLLNLRSDPVWTHAHRWRFASPAEKRDSTFHLGDDGIGLAGDAWAAPASRRPGAPGRTSPAPCSTGQDFSS